MDENVPEKPRITIKIWGPNLRIRRASVVETDRVGCLQSLFPDSPKIFLCYGEFLMPQLSFQSYGIKDGYSIVVMPKDYDETEIATWASITRDRDSFEDKIRFAVNDATKSEVARLRDLHFDRIEMRSRKFTKFADETPLPNGILGYRRQRKEMELKLEWKKTTAPNSEPMPRFWTEPPAERPKRRRRAPAPNSEP